MQRNRGVGGGGREGCERRLAGFERADDIGLLEAGQPFCGAPECAPPPY
jgi:hypothetical protein